MACRVRTAVSTPLHLSLSSAPSGHPADRCSVIPMPPSIHGWAPGASGVSDAAKLSLLRDVREHRNATSHGGVGSSQVGTLVLPSPL